MNILRRNGERRESRGRGESRLTVADVCQDAPSADGREHGRMTDHPFVEPEFLGSSQHLVSEVSSRSDGVGDRSRERKMAVSADEHSLEQTSDHQQHVIPSSRSQQQTTKCSCCSRR